MSCTLQILRRAQKQLARIPPPDFDRITSAVQELARNLRPPGCKKLTEREGWRIRIGNYRVIYEIDDLNRIVTVMDIGDRKDVYR